jgi:hypothetical protein
VRTAFVPAAGGPVQRTLLGGGLRDAADVVRFPAAGGDAGVAWLEPGARGHALLHAAPAGGADRARPLTRSLVTSTLVTRTLVTRSVMHQNTTLIDAVARDRAADLRRHGGTRPIRRAGRVRRRTGLLLVNLGLRLALR